MLETITGMTVAAPVSPVLRSAAVGYVLGEVPTPAQVKAFRRGASLTQTQAATLVHVSCRTWQQWEAEERVKSHRTMHPAFWELFTLKAFTG